MYDNSNILFEELFNEHYSQLYIHALGWIDNEESAKDIVNDVFCYLWEHCQAMLHPDTYAVKHRPEKRV